MACLLVINANKRNKAGKDSRIGCKGNGAVILKSATTEKITSDPGGEGVSGMDREVLDSLSEKEQQVGREARVRQGQ